VIKKILFHCLDSFSRIDGNGIDIPDTVLHAPVILIITRDPPFFILTCVGTIIGIGHMTLLHHGMKGVKEVNTYVSFSFVEKMPHVVRRIFIFKVTAINIAKPVHLISKRVSGSTVLLAGKILILIKDTGKPHVG